MDKNLLCAESFCSEDKMADKDQVILDDNRVLDHLLQTEVMYMPQIHSKNSDLDPSTRKIVTKWMLEVKFFSLVQFFLHCDTFNAISRASN